MDTAQNPADDCSRAMSVEKFVTTNVWWFNGPEFLKEPESEWPVQPHFSDIESLCKDPEVKAAVNIVHVLHEDPIEKLVQHYSEWHQLKKAVAYLLRFKVMLLLKIIKKHNATMAASMKEDSQQPLTAEELQKAEEAVIRYVQQKAFSKEIAALQAPADQTRKKGVSKTSPLYRLDPILVGGLLKVGGRLSSADIPLEAKHPVILPKNAILSCSRHEYFNPIGLEQF